MALDNAPLKAVAAKKLLREIIETGTVFFTKHAEERMEERQVTHTDVLNVLRGGVVDEAEWRDGGWRHLVRTARIHVAIEFDTETRCVVVTVIRKELKR